MGVGRKARVLALSCLALAAWAVHAPANVKMPAIFSNGMVLQRGMKAPVWGTADPDERITVSFAGQTVATTAGKDGRWKVALRPLAASAEGRTLSVVGKNTLRFENVLVGEVWICAGQSNMEWTAISSDHGYSGICDKAREVAAANYPAIRMLVVRTAAAPKPQDDFAGRWEVCTPGTMQWFSAIGYFFGREIHNELNVPVGLIGAYLGGTAAESWTPRETLEANAGLKQFYNGKWIAYVASYPKIKQQADAQLASWKRTADVALKRHQTAPPPPHVETFRKQNQPGALYNGMIAPLVPFAIRGVIWYQGENNTLETDDARRYEPLFTALISGWRKQWGQGDFPFLFVQLANYLEPQARPSESNWALVREAQLKTLGLKNTAMAVSIDTGETYNIHPLDKQTPAHRLAQAALKLAYGRPAPESGPVFKKMKTRGPKAILSFSALGGGLVSRSGEKLKGFAIAGSDRRFFWADARIVGDTVEVSSPRVEHPAAVRYAWADNPEASLYSKAGLPASPFRSDAWEPAEIRVNPYPQHHPVANEAPPQHAKVSPASRSVRQHS